MKYSILKTIWREGQYEIVFNILTDNERLIVGGLVHSIGKQLLDNQKLDLLFNNVIFKSITTEPVALERLYNADEVTQILKQKNYFTEDEEFSEDMDPKII